MWLKLAAWFTDLAKETEAQLFACPPIAVEYFSVIIVLLIIVWREPN